MSETKSENKLSANDVLGRKPYADFLKEVMLKKCKKPKSEKPNTEKQAPEEQELHCCVLAIDDEWGTGKTFFVQAWRQDLESQDPPFHTLYFDAWAADCMADPLLALMAELQKALISFLPTSEQLLDETKKTLNGAFQKVFKAVVVGAKVATLGYIKQKIGQGCVNAIAESLQNPQEINTDELSTKGMEAVLDHMLQEQGQQRQTIEDFKRDVKEAIQKIQGKNQQPILVFVDELDRCRPNFAVELLEGIKHLFDIPGLCFVISTNTNQLAETVKGAYGGNFDGKRYLDRLFDARFPLPKPTTDQYCQLLATRHGLGKDCKNPLLPRIDWGLPLQPDSCEYEGNAGSVFSWVAKVFDLDLRTQEKIFNRMMDAASGLPDGYRLQFLFMAVLATLAHVAPDIFEDLEGYKESSGYNLDFNAKVAVPFKRNERISFQQTDKHKENPTQGDASLFEVFMEYAKILHTTPEKVHGNYKPTGHGNQERIYYPKTNLKFILDEYPYKPVINSIANPNQLSLKLYFPLLRHAGFLHSNH